jgi:hypothetical protein
MLHVWNEPHRSREGELRTNCRRSSLDDDGRLVATELPTPLVRHSGHAHLSLTVHDLTHRGVTAAWLQQSCRRRWFGTPVMLI